MNKRICIFSRAIRSGKTTALRQWTEGRENMAGILTPDDENGRRVLVDIATRACYPLQVDQHFTGNILAIGRFIFDHDVLLKAQEVLKAAACNDPQWLVIDEVGKLETGQDKGLEPAVSHIIRQYQSETGKGKLLLVIRDTLLEKAVEKYGLDGATIFSDQLPGTDDQ